MMSRFCAFSNSRKKTNIYLYSKYIEYIYKFQHSIASHLTFNHISIEHKFMLNKKLNVQLKEEKFEICTINSILEKFGHTMMVYISDK